MESARETERTTTSIGKKYGDITFQQPLSHCNPSCKLIYLAKVE